METYGGGAWRVIGGVGLFFGVAVVALACWLGSDAGRVWAGETLRPVAKVHPSHQPGDPVETAVFAGGCYWTLEAAFRDVEGVVATRVGTAAGAEAVEVLFDPNRVSYGGILETFMKNHDPSLGAPAGGEGAAVQRTAIFIVDPTQTAIAEQVLERFRAAAPSDEPILTSIHFLATFVAAPEHDQQYFEKRGRTCRFTS